MLDRIYLDHASTTMTFPKVWEAMRAAPSGNAASAHGSGRAARRALEDARERVATLLDADPDEVVFTSGATEANNLAIFGLLGESPGHVVVSPIEHPCVVEPLKRLATLGYRVELLPIGSTGVVNAEALSSSVQPDTRLISVQLVNHETGVIQPIAELAAQAAIRNPKSAILTDAAQAIGKIRVQFHELGVTALTLSGHKFGGPQGIGALVLRKGTRFRPMLYGGHQQQGRRPGTEPVALAIGLATALEIAVHDLEENATKVRRLRQRFLDRISNDASPLVSNGEGVPHIVNVSFPGCAADSLLMALDLAGVSCSAGSACSSGSLLPSPVLRAMGLPDEILRSAIRFSFSRDTTEGEVDEAATRAVTTIQRLRNIVPE